MNYLKCSRKTLLPIICLLTIFTYGDILPAGIKNIIVYIVWGIALLECIFTCQKCFSVVIGGYVIWGVGIATAVFFLEIFGQKSYLTSPTIYSIVLALGILLIGAMYGAKLNEDDVNIICRWYVLGSLVLATHVFVSNLSTGFNLYSTVYIHLNKNAVGQIFSTAVCIIVLSFRSRDKKILIFFKGLAALFLIILMFLIRSRTSLLCFVISLVIIVISKKTNKRAKRWILITGIIAIVIFLVNDELRNTVIKNILLANRDAGNLDEITSGRMTIYGSFGALMKGKEFIGNGSRYYESFYLSAIVQFGYIVGIYIDLYVLLMLYDIRKLHKNVQYGQLLLVIAISYSLNGLLEGLPPYGPGTKNFLLWLLFGMATTHCIMSFGEGKKSETGTY